MQPNAKSRTAGHTATPWEQDGKYIWAPNAKSNVAAVSEPRPESPYVGYVELARNSNAIKEAYANAAFIVQAVNSHDALVEALKAVKRDFVYSNQSWESEPLVNAALSKAGVAL